jgi:branched-chain amino acid transport system permease protein
MAVAHSPLRRYRRRYTQSSTALPHLMAQQILNALILGSIYTLFSLGLSLAWGVANILNLAHGALFVIGALISYDIAKSAQLSLPIMLPIAAIAGGFGAVLLDIVAFSPITRRNLQVAKRERAIILASLGAAAIVENVANVQTDFTVQIIPSGVYGVDSYEVAGLRITNIAIVVVVLTVIVATALMTWLRKSAHGRAVRAVAFNRDLAPLFGINATRLSRLMLFVGGGLAGAAGLLLTIELAGFDSYTGDNLMLKAFAVVIIGGVGSLSGTVIAAYILALAETFIIAYLPSSIPSDVVSFAMIILVLVFRPQGLRGIKQAERA